MRGSRLSGSALFISSFYHARARSSRTAVRFLHTKTALCDRKDTQSRFAINAARSIVCVGTLLYYWEVIIMFVSMPHAALCVSGHEANIEELRRMMFQCRTQHCVCRDDKVAIPSDMPKEFQCRTQHCVCRDSVSRSPCPARAAPFWKDETVECGFAPVPEHFPFPSPL